MKTDKEKRSEDLRERFEKVKAQTGLSYELFARAMGLSVFTLMKWVNRKVICPSPMTLNVIEGYLLNHEAKRKQARS